MDDEEWDRFHRIISVGYLLGGNRRWNPIPFIALRMADDLPAFFDSMDCET